MARRPFLTARWEDLLLLNYACPAALLEPLVPRGTRLDPWNGVPLISLVGFMFRDTRVRGIGFPGHRTFEEVNLRFYVRREVDGETRRGVVFIRELVPRWIIAKVARVVYNEPYLCVPMSHRVDLVPEVGGSVEYGWRFGDGAFRMAGSVEGSAAQSATGSEAEFITEHYWGYTRQRDGGTLEYRVDHPRWPVWAGAHAEFSGDAAALYGADFADVLSRSPRSAFLATGSEVAVYPGQRI